MLPRDVNLSPVYKTPNGLEFTIKNFKTWEGFLDAELRISGEETTVYDYHLNKNVTVYKKDGAWFSKEWMQLMGTAIKVDTVVHKDRYVYFVTSDLRQEGLALLLGAKHIFQNYGQRARGSIPEGDIFYHCRVFDLDTGEVKTLGPTLAFGTLDEAKALLEAYL